MSLEVPTQQTPDKILTPEMIKALEIGYENEMENLRDKNLKYLKKADKIKVVDGRKKTIMRLGGISIEAAKANEELKRELH